MATDSLEINGAKDEPSSNGQTDDKTDNNRPQKISNTFFFTEICKPLASAKSLKETLNLLMYQVGDIFQPMNWSLLLKDPKSNEMVFTIVVGVNKNKLLGVRLPVGEGIAGYILNSGKSLIVDNVEQDERFCKEFDANTGFKTQSIIGVPLKTDDKVFGVIELINKISGDNFTESELALLSSIADYAAIALERVYYNQTLKKIAFIDPVTGLYNKQSFDKTLETRLQMFNTYNLISSLLMVDIADFNSINRQCGDIAGDNLLKDFSLKLKESFRAEDEFFRYYADKFCVIMPQITIDKAQEATEKFLEKLTEWRFLSKNIEIKVLTAIYPVDIKIKQNIYDFLSKKDYKGFKEKFSYSESELKEQEFYTGEVISAVDDSLNIGDMATNLQSMLDNEEDDSVDAKKECQEDNEAKEKSKTSHYKDVNLNGTYSHYNQNLRGFMTVLKLSEQGICFQTVLSNKIAVGNIIDVSFNLDDPNNSLIERRLTIDFVDGKYVEAQFYNPPPYDSRLGFYLMPCENMELIEEPI
ncbi:MAG: sensor domain-containing diguanylate cyclase [Desulfamplus sp.]|nr:sensor domain-containing diguanylate cyclase [Desulfamplus sp.]